MGINITAEKMVQAKLTDAATAAKVAPALDAACKRFGIDTDQRIACFLAQCAHESCDFKVTVENLNYGAQALTAIKKYFPDAATVAAYAHQPEKIANRMYANRMGNGPESSGDGWKHRGRGYIQLTGKDNYAAFTNFVGRPDAFLDPDLVAEPDLAALSAAWFWWDHKLNALADTPGIEDETRVINGGLNGEEDRELHFKLADPIDWEK